MDLFDEGAGRSAPIGPVRGANAATLVWGGRPLRTTLLLLPLRFELLLLLLLLLFAANSDIACVLEQGTQVSEYIAGTPLGERREDTERVAIRLKRRTLHEKRLRKALIPGIIWRSCVRSSKNFKISNTEITLCRSDILES